MATAMSVASFVATLGVNTHIDFAKYGYQNLSTVKAAINYLGLKNLRDSPQTSSDVYSWKQVSQATSAKFDAYIPEGSPSDMRNSLNLMPSLAQAGVLNYIEGGNEEDDPYAASLGNTLQITADFQKNSVWPMGQKLGLPVINMSFGAGWTAANGWIGDYASVGDLAAYATYGNAHTYPMPGQTPDSTIQRLNGLAKLADSTDRVITTEIGWNRSQGYSQQTVAKYVLDGTMDGIKDGDAKMYFYALFDDGSGQFGLMNQNGTPMPAGTAMHNLTTLLSDKTGKFTTGSLSYSLANATSNDKSLLLEKSDGTYWISLWNEVDAAHNVTVKLPSVATDVKVFDPLAGVSARQDVKGVSSVTVRLIDHPMLVEVTPGTTVTPPPPPPTLQPDDLVISVPASGDTVTANTTSALPGVSVTDPWAAQTPGLMALNLWDNSGAPLFVNGQQVTGTLNLTLSQLNADLAGLSYKAGAAGSDTVFVNVWNQAGIHDTESFGVSIKAASSGTMLFIGGTDVPANLMLSTEPALAGQGYNMAVVGGTDTSTNGSTASYLASSELTSTGDRSSTDGLVTHAKELNDLIKTVTRNGHTADFRSVPKGTTGWADQWAQSSFAPSSTADNHACMSGNAVAFGATMADAMHLHLSGSSILESLLAAHSIS